MAWRIDASCVDGVVYFRLAGELEQNRLDEHDGGHLQIGTYPLALATLHRLGLEWEQAAELYGVLLSTLAVLPLFGWVRRQFDDRVAIVACLFYAAHPKLIEWSPEAVREPSFWFFFLLALYLIWRATAEVDWRWFVAAGIATALAGLTRFEGWFLLFPFLGWTALRYFRLQTGRARLMGGFISGAAALPIVLWAFGQTMPGGTGWRNLRIEPIERRRQLAFVVERKRAPRGRFASHGSHADSFPGGDADSYHNRGAWSRARHGVRRYAAASA